MSSNIRHLEETIKKQINKNNLLAMKCAEKIVFLDKSRLALLYSVGSAYHNAGKIKDAKGVFRKILKKYRNINKEINALCYYKLALISKCDKGKCTKHLKMCLFFNPKHWKANIMLKKILKASC